jgi:hypothetical protein
VHVGVPRPAPFFKGLRRRPRIDANESLGSESDRGPLLDDRFSFSNVSLELDSRAFFPAALLPIAIGNPRFQGEPEWPQWPETHFVMFVSEKWVSVAEDRTRLNAALSMITSPTVVSRWATPAIELVPTLLNTSAACTLGCARVEGA